MGDGWLVVGGWWMGRWVVDGWVMGGWMGSRWVDGWVMGGWVGPSLYSTLIIQNFKTASANLKQYRAGE